MGVDAEGFGRAEKEHDQSIGEELKREESALAERFARSASATRRRLKAESPPLESLGPRLDMAPPVTATRPEAPPSHEAPPLPAPAEVVSAPAPSSASTSPGAPAALPSFMAAAARPAPPLPPSPPVAPPAVIATAPVRTEGTLPVLILPNMAVPFAAGDKGGEHAVLRAKDHAAETQGPGRPPAALSGETVAPSDLAAVLKRVMPSGWGGRWRPSAPARPPVATPVSPASSAPSASTARAISSFTMERYASLCEDLSATSDPAEVASLLRYRLSAEDWRGLDAYWQGVFRERPAVVAEWERARATYRAWLAHQRGRSRP